VRVLYFTRDYTPHDHRILSALAHSQHEVFSLRLEKNGMRREGRPLPETVKQVVWKGGQKPFSWKDAPFLVNDFKRVLAEVKPDVVHAGPIPTVAFIAAMSGFKPLVSMSWGSDLLKDADSSRWLSWTTRYTLDHTTILLSDCDVVKQKAVSLGFDPKRVVQFPWGVDLQRFTPVESLSKPERSGWEKEFVLFSNRSWEPLYGVDLLVRAFIRAAQQTPELRLLMLGGGSQKELIHDLIDSAGMQERVRFIGQIRNDELAGYYRAADLYLSASHSDGSSVSLMEALACGKPVLVSDIPGNKEWILNGEQGWLFTDGDEDSFVEGILHASRMRSMLPGMGQKARLLAERRADWSKNFQTMLGAYEQARLLEGKS